MELDPSYQVYLLLKQLNIRINKKYIRQELLAHPDFPSAFAITDFLDEHGINNNAYEISADDLKDLEGPALAILDGQNFYYIKNINLPQISVSDFFNRWNGIIILAEKPEVQIKSNKLLQSERQLSFKNNARILLLSLTLTLLIPTIFAITISHLYFLLLALIGILFSLLAMKIETGKFSNGNSKMCGESGFLSCKSIIQDSKPIWSILYVPDIALSFFMGIALLIIVNTIIPLAADTFIRLASFASVIPIILSIHYQAFTAKKWCTICLSIIACLLAMILLTLNTEMVIEQSINSKVVASLAFILLPGTMWINFKIIRTERDELRENNITLSRFRKNTALFKMSLMNQSKISSVHLRADLQIANKDAACQVVAILSPICGPCLEAYEVLKKLRLKYGDQIGITIRFSLGKETVVKEPIVRSMLSYLANDSSLFDSPEKIIKMLDTWFQTQDLNHFSKMYSSYKNEDVLPYITEMQEWIRASNVSYTPTIFINGYKLSDPYIFDDLLEQSAFFQEVG